MSRLEAMVGDHKETKRKEKKRKKRINLVVKLLAL